MQRADEPDPSTNDGEVRTEYRGTGLMGGAVLVLVGIALVIVVALQNTQEVAFEFLWADLSVPLIVLLLITVGITVLIDEVIGFVWRRRRRNRLSEKAELRRLRAANDSGG